MKRASGLLAQRKAHRYLLPLAAFYLWNGAAAVAQNIDEGKSAQRLFADTCVNCHRNPAALAKGRFRATLFTFLHDHYTTGTAEAWALASYLASVDAGPPRSKKTAAAKKRPPAGIPSSRSNGDL